METRVPFESLWVEGPVRTDRPAWSLEWTSGCYRCRNFHVPAMARSKVGESNLKSRGRRLLCSVCENIPESLLRVGRGPGSGGPELKARGLGAVHIFVPGCVSGLLSCHLHPVGTFS